jgi:uncharacterized protein
MMSGVPLFPLPNVVLFPGAILPLHIFEHRYKLMMEHALQGSRQIAMALLRPGWEKSYYDCPAIEPVVCLGTILTHERLDDGCYNLLLQGTTRARVLSELPRAHPFRLADLDPICSRGNVMEIDVSDLRTQLHELLQTKGLKQTSWGRSLRRLLDEPISTIQLADLMAFSMIEDVHLKQSLLADPDPRHRISRTISAIRRLLPMHVLDHSTPYSLN